MEFTLRKLNYDNTMQPYPTVIRIVFSIPLASSQNGDIERSHARAASEKKKTRERGARKERDSSPFLHLSLMRVFRNNELASRV